mgnify:CR=1 FL=1
MKSNHLVASFLYTHADVLIKIVFDAEPRPDIPQIYIRIKRTDMVYVLQVKVESALANVAPNYAVSADELDLEHKGQRLKETRALDFYSITEGSEVVACADMHIPEPLVRTGYACRPPACSTYRHRAACTRGPTAAPQAYPRRTRGVPWAPQAHLQWFYFRATASEPGTVQYEIANAAAVSFPLAWEGTQVCASTDRKVWTRVDATTYDEERCAF